MRRFNLAALFGLPLGLLHGLLLLSVGAPIPAAAQSSAAYVPDVVRSQEFQLSVRNIMRLSLIHI